jgi:transposase-like protein
MQDQFTESLVCPACSSQHRQIRNGKTVDGRQRYLCRDCGHRYTESPRSNAYPASLREQAVRLYLEQNGFRRIGRLLGVNHQTVVNWIREREQKQPPAPQPKKSEIVEMDELYAMHLKKGTSSSSPRS